MYVKDGLKDWAVRVIGSTSTKEQKKLQAWWFGMPVKFGKSVTASKKGEAFEIWGKDFAVAHGKALKAVMEG